jgi:transmembrane sensor
VTDRTTSPDERSGRKAARLDAEAAAWLVRLEGGPLDAAGREALEAWLAIGPEHPAALVEAREAWNELGRLPPLPPSAANDNPRSPVRRRALGALAASLVVAAGLGALRLGDPVTAFTADHRTGPGERRHVLLPDGSQAELDSGTALALRYDAGRRTVELLEGEAVFTARPAEQAGGRPFVVAAAGGEAEALGTRFLVARRGERTLVSVLEHRVGVAAPVTDGTPERIVLEAGQQVAYSRQGLLGPAQAVEPDAVAPWRDGRLVFDRLPLAEAVATLNRYRTGRILVLDPALGARRVSGVFNLDQLDGALGIIVAELEARSLQIPPFVTLLY